MTDSLPSWPGASSCYSRAYRLLEKWAVAGSCQEETTDLIDALNRGDEESIKATLMFPDYHAA